MAGPEATKLAEQMPWQQLAAVLPEPLGALRLVGAEPGAAAARPGVELQLVHHDDVASAIALAALAAGPPGEFNLAGDGEITFAEVERATGTRSLPVPRAAARAAAAVIVKLPRVPAAAEWIHLGKVPMVTDCSRAKDVLGWTPEFTSAETLSAMIRG